MAYTEYYSDISSGKLKNIYAFYGPERFILKSMIELTKSKIIEEGCEALDFIDLDGKGMSFEEAKNIFDHLPFFSSKRLIIIREADFIQTDKWAKDKIDKFMEIQKNSEHTICIMIFEKIDKRKYGFKALSKVGKIVEFSRIDRNELLNWIKLKFKEFECKTTTNVLDYIADNCTYLEKDADFDLGSLYSLIKIICDASKKDLVELSDVQVYLPNKLESNVFKWRSCVLSGKIKESFSYLYALLHEGESPIKLMYMLEAQIKDFYLYTLLKKAGMNNSQIAKKMGKQMFMISEIENISKGKIAKNIENLMQVLLEADDSMKVGGLDGELVLQNLSFKILALSK